MSEAKKNVQKPLKTLKPLQANRKTMNYIFMTILGLAKDLHWKDLVQIYQTIPYFKLEKKKIYNQFLGEKLNFLVFFMQFFSNYFQSLLIL